MVSDEIIFQILQIQILGTRFLNPGLAPTCMYHFHGSITITEEDLSEIRTKFTKERSSLPLMYVATPYDKFKSTWTKDQPSVQILQRLVLLAHESLNVIQTQHTQLHADVKVRNQGSLLFQCTVKPHTVKA